MRPRPAAFGVKHNILLPRTPIYVLSSTSWFPMRLLFGKCPAAGEGAIYDTRRISSTPAPPRADRFPRRQNLVHFLKG